MSTLYLVSCVSQKKNLACKAKELYTSDWFTKARAFVLAQAAPWFILSAEHGLLDPEAVVAPYERTLNTMGVAARRAWAARIRERLAQLPRFERVVVLAGQRYREFLLPYLREICPNVEVPMEGMRIGEQLRWLKEQG